MGRMIVSMMASTPTTSAALPAQTDNTQVVQVDSIAPTNWPMSDGSTSSVWTLTFEMPCCNTNLNAPVFARYPMIDEYQDVLTRIAVAELAACGIDTNTTLIVITGVAP